MFVFAICALFGLAALIVGPMMGLPQQLRKIVPGIFFFFAFVGGAIGGFSYNDAGYCVHIRTIFGGESAKCNLGWYFSGWGTATQYPHYITIAHTNETDSDGSSILPPYPVRLADNWSGDVIQVTRFGIPQDAEQFIKMARDFRSVERLITAALRPSVTASLDSVANLYTMEEYYVGGQRDEFKTEFRNAVIKGRAVIERKEVVTDNAEIDRNVTPNDSGLAEDTADTGGSDSIRYVAVKKLDANGNEIRVKHGYVDYGITVSDAILQNIDPVDAYEEQIQKRKDAAARRSVAREQRLEQEEQRLLTIATAETQIAQKQGEARQLQIERTTNAETEKQLALIAADRQRGEARIAKETAQINFERAEIDAQAKKVTADAEAYQKEAIITADGALQQKLDAWVTAQRAWAEAFANRAVPATVFASGSGEAVSTDSDIQSFMDIMTMNAAKQLQLDMQIRPQE